MALPASKDLGDPNTYAVIATIANVAGLPGRGT